MDGPEEELRNKLLLLERSVLDPALNGRSEEIWARMVSVRERGRLLQREFEMVGRVPSREQGQVVDEEVMKRVKKVCSVPYLITIAANSDTDFGRLQLTTRGSYKGASTAPSGVGGVGAIKTSCNHKWCGEIAFVSSRLQIFCLRM